MKYKKHLKYAVGALGVMSLALAVSCRNTDSSNNRNTSASSTQQETTSSAQSTTQMRPPASTEPAKSIPDFTFYILESGIRFNKEDLAKNGNNMVFMLFDPSCGHCQDEARDLSQHYDRIKDTNVYFVSMNDLALMSRFLRTHAKQLVNKDTITFLYEW